VTDTVRFLEVTIQSFKISFRCVSPFKYCYLWHGDSYMCHLM